MLIFLCIDINTRARFRVHLPIMSVMSNKGKDLLHFFKRKRKITDDSYDTESDSEANVDLPTKRSRHNSAPCVSTTPKKQRKTGIDPEWKNDFPWFNESEGGMLCELCIRHQRRPKKTAIGQAIWVDKPCTWLVRSALTRHEGSDTHDEARQFEANRLAPNKIKAAVKETVNLNLRARIAAFRNIYWLMMREMPHTTNYLPLNELCKQQGVSILNNLHQGDNNKGESKRFIQEVVLTIGRVIRQSILDEVKASPWYSLMIDETTDIAVVSEMIVYVRYLKAGNSRTEFLSVLPLPNGTADTILTTLLQLLEDVGLRLDDMCAFGSDGASVMVGRKNGVAAKLRARIPHLLNNHCVAHRLALAVGQAAKGVQYLPKFKDIVGDLHRFYDKSPVRTHGLNAIQELLNDPKLKLAEAKDVRWLSHDKATTTLRKCLPSIYASLEREAEERNDARAAGLAVFTQDYRFVLSVHMMCDVLPHMTSLSLAMQRRDVVYSTIKPLVNGTIAIISRMKDCPGEYYKGAEAKVMELHAQNYKIRLPNSSDLTKFHEKVYLPFLTNIIQNLEDRFPDLPIIEKFGVFNCTMPDDQDDHGNQEIKELARHFNLPEEQPVANWQQVKTSLQNQKLSADETMGWIATNLAVSHEPLWKIAVIGLLLPTSTADCERGFSTLKRIKTENRSCLSNPVLNALLTVSMQGPPLDTFDFESCVKEWHKERPRRAVV